MIYRQIIGTDMLASRIGFGCAPLSNHDYGIVNAGDVHGAVRIAIDLGVNLFDTADIYGFGAAEEMLSAALGADRHSVIIATKFGLMSDRNGKVVRDCSPKNIRKSLDGSLKRLRVDCIPLYQLHWYDNETPFDAIMETLDRCREEGKIAFFGCSNLESSGRCKLFSSPHMVCYQAPYNLLNRGAENEIFADCRMHDVSFVAHSPLARGFLSGNHVISKVFDGTDTRNNSSYFNDKYSQEKGTVLDKLYSISEKYDISPVQISLNWLLNKTEIASVLIGIKNVSQLNEAICAINTTLSENDYRDLDSISDQFKMIRLY